MKTFKIEDITYSVPEYKVREIKDQDGEAQYWIELQEGKFDGIALRFDDIKMCETDASLLEYNLFTSETVEDMESLREITNNIMLSILNEQLLKAKEQSTSEQK